MLESWRWFGPLDAIPLGEVAQTGASGVVTSLHELDYGAVWTKPAIRERQKLIADAGLGLTWAVVESLPVHEDIKRGTGDLHALFANYRQSLANLAMCDVRTVCYNFMPVLDWTRTTLDAPQRGGARGLRFDAGRMAAFEIDMLGRREAEADYSEAALTAGRVWFQASSETDRDELLASVMAGLPGAYARYDIDGLRAVLARWKGFDRAALRETYARFLDEVVPAADELGVRLCVHPDDPPRDILGLPRIVSNAEDIAWALDRSDSRANGLTLCSGSLGANPANDVPAIAARFADRIHFAHLRNVAKEPDGSFNEAPHLTGDTDMVALVAVLLAEEARRREAGRSDAEIPFRPDHGHEIGPDIDRSAHPGYPLVGRLRGLAELRGVIAGLTHKETAHA